VSSVTKEYLLESQGRTSVLMTDSTKTACFLTHTRGWYEGSEECHIDKQGDRWELWSKFGSTPGGSSCGARCVNIMGKFETYGNWYQVGDAQGGSVSQELSVGVSTTETTTITKEWSTSFTESIESGCEFMKVTMSWTAEKSTAKSVSDAVTHIATNSITGNCDARKNNHTWLYQWVVEGRHPDTPVSKDPDAAVMSHHWQCAWSTPGHKEPIPQCPWNFCGDAACSAKNCQAWKK